MLKRSKELAKLWLEKAYEDILWAKDSLEDKHFAGVCFLSQQASEKALKAYLFHQDEKLLRTHNLMRLLKRCQKYETKFGNLAPAVTILP